MTVEEKLTAAGIELLDVDVRKHRIAMRGIYIALIEHSPERGFGKAGTAGLLTESGLAPLVWVDGSARFRARGVDQPATDEQIAELRAFQSDLDKALSDR